MDDYLESIAGRQWIYNKKQHDYFYTSVDYFNIPRCSEISIVDINNILYSEIFRELTVKQSLLFRIFNK